MRKHDAAQLKILMRYLLPALLVVCVASLDQYPPVDPPVVGPIDMNYYTLQLGIEGTPPRTQAEVEAAEINAMKGITLRGYSPYKTAPTPLTFPSSWGEPPEPERHVQRCMPLPGGYGHGSSSLGRWIEEHMKREQKQKATISYPPAFGEPPHVSNPYLTKTFWDNGSAKELPFGCAHSPISNSLPP